MKALVLIEVSNQQVSHDSLGVLSKSVLAGFEVTALLCGHHVLGMTDEIAGFGASEILVADGADFASPLRQIRVDLIEAVVKERDFSAILFTATTLATDIAGALIARLEAGCIWSLVDIAIRGDRLIGTRATHEDAMHAEIEWTTPIRIGLFRPRLFEAIASSKTSLVELLAVNSSADRSWFDAEEVTQSNPVATAPLARADIVVGAGRGIGKQENLILLRTLAECLEATLGVSLPLVEMGWAPRAIQIGQTGTTIRPRLYIACGISGQIQHKIGIERSGKIVAINTDRNAPIMNYCDLAIVGSVQQILPKLIELLKTESGNTYSVGSQSQ